MAELLVQYSAGTAFASGLIRRLTHSRFSHVDFVLPDEGLLGVSGPDPATRDPGGVRVRPFNAWPYRFPPIVARIQARGEVVQRSIEYARSQIGKAFDNGALYHFLRDRAGLPGVGRDWREDQHWFCSELIIRATEVGGLFSYPLAITKDVVSPNDTLLLFNPFLPHDNILELL